MAINSPTSLELFCRLLRASYTASMARRLLEVVFIGRDWRDVFSRLLLVVTIINVKVIKINLEVDLF